MKKSKLFITDKGKVDDATQKTFAERVREIRLPINFKKEAGK